MLFFTLNKPEDVAASAADALATFLNTLREELANNNGQQNPNPEVIPSQVIDGSESPTPTSTPEPTAQPTAAPLPNDGGVSRLPLSGEAFCNHDFSKFDPSFQSQPIDSAFGSLSFRTEEGNLKIDSVFSSDDRFMEFELPCGSTADFDLRFDFSVEDQSAETPIRLNVSFRHQNQPGSDMRQYFAIFSTSGFYGIYFIDPIGNQIETVIQQDLAELEMTSGESANIRMVAKGQTLSLRINDKTIHDVIEIDELSNVGNFKMGLDGKAGQAATVTIDNLRVSNTQ
ncbi:MAG: hypothetical protein AAF633_15530 [Chloroflexota bacterium]